MARSRSLTAGLSRLLSEVRSPVYVLDEKRAIVYINAAAETWLSVSGEELAGRRCDYTSVAYEEPISQITAALSPPPAAWQGECTTGLLECPSAEGGVSRRWVRFLPLGDAIDCEGVLAVVAPEEADDVPSERVDTLPESEDLHLKLQRFRRTVAGRYRLDRLVGDSAAMGRVRRQVMLAIEAGARAVVIGPPGSGREHVARTIHFAGDDARAPTLMPLACPLLDAELLQTSITAFARHAAESQSQAKPTTRRPTLLLCDADQLSESAQTELAGFLALPGFDLHVLATARTSLLKLADAGAFRRDLAFALSTLEIDLPPLAARRGDIPLLAQMFLEQHNAQDDQQLAGFDAAAMDVLCEHAWDENLDELRDVVARACDAAAGSRITRDDLPPHVLSAVSTPLPPTETEAPIVLDDVLAEVESELIRRAMRLSKGNKTKAAELLGISRPRLHRRWEEMERGA